MPVFHLNIREDGVLRLDHEGQDFPSLAAAREDAVAGAREILADQISSGQPVAATSIEITDAGGTMLESIALADMVASKPVTGSPRRRRN